MTEMIVTHPADAGRIAQFEPEALRLQAELRAIESLANGNCCRVCGEERPLSFEHTPSRSAGNRAPAIQYSVDEAKALSSGVITWHGTKRQRGIGQVSLCEACNNSTGSWFNPQYVDWVRRLREHAHPGNVGKTVSIPLPVRPMLVIKQALTTVLATCQPGLSTRYPELKRLLKDRDATEPLGPLRIFTFLVASTRCPSRSTGLSWSIDMPTGRGWLWAEFTHWPVGWILAIDIPNPIDGSIDISSWMAAGGPIEGSSLAMPCQWVLGNHLADFRPPEAFRQIGA